jgi:hypothetical protein
MWRDTFDMDPCPESRKFNVGEGSIGAQRANSDGRRTSKAEWVDGRKNMGEPEPLASPAAMVALAE